MGWTRTENGSYKRPIDQIAKLIYASSLGAEKKSAQLFACVSITTSYPEADLITRLQKAWVAVHHKYPHVGSTTEDYHFVYTPFKNQIEVDNWVKETFIVFGDTQDPKDLIEIHANRPRLYYLPLVQKVVFHIPHYTADGLSTVLFFNTLFPFVVENKDYNIVGLDDSRLSPTLGEAIGGIKYSEEIQAQADKILQDYGTSFPSVGPTYTPTGRISKSIVVGTKFTKEETNEIYAKSKARGTTFTSAVHAAYIELLIDDEKALKNGEFTKNFATLFPISLRGLIKNSDIANDPFTVYHTATHLHYTTEGTSQDRLDRATKYVSDNAKSIKENVPTSSYPAEFPLDTQFAIGSDLFKPFTSPDPSNPPNPNLTITSSLGVIDSVLSFDHPDLQVNEYWFSCYSDGPFIALACWTFKGQFNFRLEYSEKFYEDAYVESIRDRLRLKILELIN